MLNQGMIPDEADAETGDTGTADAPDTSGFNVLAEVMSYGRKKHRLPEKLFAAADQRPIPPKPNTVPGGKFNPRDFLPGGPGTTKMIDDGDEDDAASGDTGTQMFATGGGVEGMSEEDQQRPDPSNAYGIVGSRDMEPDEHEPERFEQVPEDVDQKNRHQRRERERINEEDGATNQGAPPTTMAYLQGADAMPADMAQALEARVDPQGTMNPSQRKMQALQAAGSPERAWGLLQHYRQKFNAYNAFAQAAMEGAGGRPANPAAAADAANKAYENLPDGKSMRFEPVQGGVKVRIQDLSGPELMRALGAGRGRANGLPVQQFAEGGSVEGEDETEQPVIPDQEDQELTTGTVPEREQPGPIQQALGGRRPDQALKEFVLSIPQFLGWLKKDGQVDNVMDKGVETTLAEAQKQQAAQQNPMSPGAAGTFSPPMQPQGPQQQRMPMTPPTGFTEGPSPSAQPGFDRTPVKVPSPENYTLKDVLHEIDQQYPSVGMSEQRSAARREAIQQWMLNRTKVEAEQTKGQGALERARATGQYGVQRAQISANQRDTASVRHETNANSRVSASVEGKKDVANIREGGQQRRFDAGERGKNFRTMATAKPSMIGNEKKTQEAMDAVPGQRQQAPAPQMQGQAPQQPRQQQFQQAPAADQRKAGVTYQTPKGPLTWTGTGWVQPSR